MTDILESIAGELPDASEIEGPDVIEDNGGFVVSGALNWRGAATHRICGATDRRLSNPGRLVVSLLDRLPMIGDSHEWQGWRMTVLAGRATGDAVFLARVDG
jgi:CBS domain containing-hemolysin-like protein